MAKNIVLHFGFENMPYTAKTMAAPMRAAEAARGKKRRAFRKSRTVERVAGILEDNYGIVQQFNEKYKDEIEDTLRDSVQLSLIDILPIGDEEVGYKQFKVTSQKMVKYLQPDTIKIEKMFRRFLDRSEVEVMGEPVKIAAKKHRPPFIDTGLYRASFRVWGDIK
jgi:hypothetical protein